MFTVWRNSNLASLAHGSSAAVAEEGCRCFHTAMHGPLYRRAGQPASGPSSAQRLPLVEQKRHILQSKCVQALRLDPQPPPRLPPGLHLEPQPPLPLQTQPPPPLQTQPPPPPQPTQQAGTAEAMHAPLDAVPFLQVDPISRLSLLASFSTDFLFRRHVRLITRHFRLLMRKIIASWVAAAIAATSLKPLVAQPWLPL